MPLQNRFPTGTRLCLAGAMNIDPILAKRQSKTPKIRRRAKILNGFDSVTFVTFAGVLHRENFENFAPLKRLPAKRPPPTPRQSTRQPPNAPILTSGARLPLSSAALGGCGLRGW